jgi:hypothetical protein
MANSIMITDAELEVLMTQLTAQQGPIPAPVPQSGKGRIHHRWLVFNLYANLYWRGQDYYVKVNDISLGGLGLEAPLKSFVDGARGVLILDLDEYGTVATPVEVAYVCDGAHTQRCGIRFLPCEPEDLQPLTAYIDSIASQ